MVRKHLLHDHRREAQRRLVQHDELGQAHQAAADREHLLLAAGHRPRGLPAPLGEARKQREHLLHRLRPLGARARQERADLQVVLDAEAREHLPALGDLPDAEVRGEVRVLRR